MRALPPSGARIARVQWAFAMDCWMAGHAAGKNNSRDKWHPRIVNALKQ